MRFLNLAMAALGLAAFAVGDIAPAHRRDEVSLTFPITRSCSSDSTQKLQHAQTSVCTVSKTVVYDQRPCATSLFAYWACVPTVANTSKDFGGTRSQRFVARYAEATPAGAVVQDAEITTAPEPTLAQADAATPPFPTCSFDLTKGEYVCPAAATKLKTVKQD